MAANRNCQPIQSQCGNPPAAAPKNPVRRPDYSRCFTFADMPEIEDAAQRWRHFINWLVRNDNRVYGVRMYELREFHGLHLHALINQCISVRRIRPMTRRYGFGRIHVKLLIRAAADYLGKYLTKQGRTAWLKGKRLWAGFGKFDKTRVKDILVESNFTRAVKFWQAELGKTKLPFVLVDTLQQWPTTDPGRMRLTCLILKRNGPCYPDILQVLRG
jgi:hypothetical protein